MAPINVTVMAVSGSTLEVSWVPTSATLMTYSVHYHPTNTAGLSPVGAWPHTPQTNLTSAQLTNLQPFTNYSGVVVASAMCGSSLSAVIVGATAESPPTAPVNVRIAATLPTRVKVQWNMPTNPNGIVTHYNVSIEGV